MEINEAIKISLSCQVAQKAVEVLQDIIDHSEVSKRNKIREEILIDSIRRVDLHLQGIYSDIREHIEPIFDAEDEQAIIDLVCNIEKALNQRPVPVPVHPEISNILNKHLGEK